MVRHEELEALMAQQRALLDRLNSLDSAPGQLLELGTEVLRFAEHEERAFFPLLPLLDPIARAELAHEHDEIGEDLKLLEWLLTTTPDSPDVEILARAVVRKIRAHVERDGRLLLRASRLDLAE
jgi:Hemerythrin HHE cation binding domain